MIKAHVLLAANGDLPAGWPLVGHTHDYYHLFYLRNGNAVYLLDGKPYSIRKGQMLIVPPGMIHEVSADGHSLLDVDEIKFVTGQPVDLPLLSEADAYLEQSVQKVIYSWISTTGAEQADADLFLSAMLTALLLASGAQEQVSTYITTDEYSPLVCKIIHYIENMHTEPFSLDLVAEALGYNKRYLCSVFRQGTGITMLDYLHHVRIRHATLCFYYHDAPIGVIAEYVGFITPVYFTRVFKKLVGISPNLFRKHYRPGNTAVSEQAYDNILGLKILPLHDAIFALQELGRQAAKKSHKQEP